jgi:hypothetical protein
MQPAAEILRTPASLAKSVREFLHVV